MKNVYYHGTIYTGNGTDASAMVVEEGKITFTGTGEEAEAYAGREGTQVEYCDLEGRFVVPGFDDSHLHLLNYGHTLSLLDLTGCTSSMEDMLHGISKYIEGHSDIEEGTWIVGRGWNHDYFQGEKRFPNRHDLDLVSTKWPIFVVRACGHIACANSRALSLAGITKDTVCPEGGQIDYDENGEPNGIFREYGVDLVNRVIPGPSKREIKEYMVLAMKKLNSFGITSAQSDDLAAFPGIPYEMVLDVYRELEVEGRMTVKVYEQCLLSNLELLMDFMGHGYHTGVGDEWFRIGPLKLLADGSLGAGTAYLGQPYADDPEHPDNRGIAIYKQEELNELIAYANSHKMQVAVHAIGDGAMEMVVQAYEKALESHPVENHRHGIVHCQITTKALLDAFRKWKLHAYVQTIFLDYDNHIVESRVGKERAKDTYRFKTLLDMGVDVSNGSDSPVEQPDVLKGIQCAVTRATLDGTKVFLKDEAMSVDEAIHTYTEMGARASFEEEKKGRIMPGMAADFTVLDRDIRLCPPQQIKDAKVCKTYVNGVCVYDRR